jgi:hypothetical protein
MITKFGKRFITNVLAGNVSFANRELAFGIGSTAATDGDTRLEFEFYRMPVSFGSIDIQETSPGSNTYNYYVIYKGTIPQDIAGEIKEIALYPGTRTSLNNYDNRFIADFEDNTNWFDSGNSNPPIVTTPSAKIGLAMIDVTATSNSTKEYKAKVNSFDISGYSVNDTITLAYYKNDNNLSNIKVRFYSSATAYYESTIVTSPASGTGHRISSVSLSNMLNNPVNSPDSKDISEISIIVTATNGGTSTVYFDGLRINDEDTFDPSYGVIARSVLSTALTKVAGRPTDIEYKMELTF